MLPYGVIQIEGWCIATNAAQNRSRSMATDRGIEKKKDHVQTIGTVFCSDDVLETEIPE